VLDVVDCQRCKTPIPDTSRFCMNCGAVVSGDTGLGTTDLLAQAGAELLVLLREALADDFVVERELGRGGMAAVFLARETALDRPVAIKVLPPELTFGKGMVDRFIREARTAAGLGHPHIIPIYRVSPASGRLFWYAMKYVEGTDLASVLAGASAVPIPRALGVLDCVAQALDYAHRNGVIHRDVKPANIMLTEADWVYVTDFGIAKALGSTALTGSGGMIGTPHYMSPEQCRGQPVTAAADQYSLAVMTYQILGRRLPFAGDSVIDIVTQHATSDPPALREIRPDLPEAVSRVVQRGMAKDPAARFRSTLDFVSAVRAALAADNVGERTTEPVPRVVLRQPKQPQAARPWRRGGWLLLAAFVTAGAAGGLAAARPDLRMAFLEWIGLREPAAAVAPPMLAPIHVPPPTALLRIAVAPPQAVVTVDGRPVASDTVTVLLGDIVIRASAPGFRDSSVARSLSRAGQVEAVAISLERLPAVRPPPPAAPAQPAVGYLRVFGWPYSRVEVGGRPYPQRWPLVVALPPGVHQVLVRREGFVSLDTLLGVSVGDTTLLKVELREGQ
jgi:hypothetical protein